MPFDFSGKKVLVTGAGRAIGRELSKALSAAGGDVYALSLAQANLDSLVAEVPSIHTVRVDLTDWETTRREVDKLGCFDVVNNAAVFYPVTEATQVPREWLQDTMNLNVFAAINIIQVVGNKMVDYQQGGSIVNVSSINGIKAFTGTFSYSVSKAALNMVTKQFALELGPHKIRVNSVNPYALLTDMTKVHFENNPVLKERCIATIPAGRLLTTRDVVDPIMYLLSDHSSMVTGTTSVVDGGTCCHIRV